MKKTSLLVFTSFATLSLATGAVAQGERMAPGGGGAPPAAEMRAPSGADGPSARPESGLSGAERGGSSAREGADRVTRPEAHDRSGPDRKSGDSAKSERSERDNSASTGASEGAGGRDAADHRDQSGKRSKNAAGNADHKSEKKGDASSGASEGTAGSDTKPSGSVTQLSGEKRTEVQSAFRSHKSEAIVKDIDIDVNVGVAVPSSVTLYAVPQDVVVIVPEYRSYKYFIFEDRVVIVDPATLEIVDVLVLA